MIAGERKWKKAERYIMPEYLKSYQPDPVEAYHYTKPKIANPVDFGKQTGKVPVQEGYCPVNEERFVSFKNISN